MQIRGRPGILTNHHVAMILGVKNRNWVYVPGYLGKINGLKIANFDLAGILAEEIKFIESHPALAVMCRGSCSLYDTFYKFCAHYLEDENEVAALQHAGFLQK